MLDPAGRIPPYLVVAQLVRQDIMAGRYQVNQALPAEEALAATYGVSRDTVRAAFGVLREEGLIMTRRGAGSIVRSVPPQITISAAEGDEVTARIPTPAERAALGLPEGVPVISVKRPGRGEELFDASRARVIWTS